MTYAAILAVAVGIAVAAWRKSWRLIHSSLPHDSSSQTAVDLALLSWGAASLVAAIHSPSHAGDLLNGNLIGFEAPVSAVLGWVSLVLVVSAILLQPRVITWIKNYGWTLSLVSVVLIALVGEGVARMLAVVEPEVQAFPTHRTEMWLQRFAPLNADGFRDLVHGPAHGRRRLLVLGDSYAFGWGVERRRDRLGEVLGTMLDSTSGTQWETYNVSRPDLDTRQEIDLLAAVPPVDPDVTLLLYVFNDMEYLQPMTQRTAMTEAPVGLVDRLNPWRFIFINSFLFQELYVRARHARLALSTEAETDPYADSGKVALHLRDVCRLVHAAESEGSVAVVVPFDIAPMLAPSYLERMKRFARQASGAGIPVWRVDTAFTGHRFSELAVDNLDAHPNVLAHSLAARAVAEQLLPVLRGEREAPRSDCRE
jgi:hypothetical protein